MRKKIFLLIILSVFFASRGVYAKTYTRKQLQDYIVSTALSYYYNNTSTDYEGYKVELSESTYPTLYNISPEMLSRSRKMTTQCDAFVATVYMHALGYDFVDYRADLNRGITPRTYTTYWDENGIKHFAKDSDEEMRIANRYFSKIYSVSFLNRIAYYNMSTLNNPNSIVVAMYQQATETKQGKSNLTSISSEDILKDLNTSRLAAIRTELEPLLEPGDILLNDGHAMLWVGNALEAGGGMIHSSGSSFNMENDIVTNAGHDDFSVRYSDANYYFNSQVFKHGDEDNTAITILRPLNVLCNGNTCSNITLPSETENRSIFKNLKIEEFIFNTTDNITMNANTSTIGLEDEITYKLFLLNKSNLEFCSSGKTTSQSDCVESGYEWKTSNKSQDYNGMSITGPIPNNTEFVSCSNNCKVSNGNVIWEDVNIPASNDSVVDYNYTVKVKKNNITINNSGMKITYNNTTLQLGGIDTKVINSVIGEYVKQFKSVIDKDASSTKTYSSPEKMITTFYDDFFANNTKYISSTFESRLTGSVIGPAVFTEHTRSDEAKYYERRSQTDLDSLNDKQKAINKMVVSGFYGGKKYEQLYHSSNMEYYSNRVRPLWSSGYGLNYGDIIVTLNENNGEFTIKNMFLFAGYKGLYPVYVYLQDNHPVMHNVIDNYNNTGKKYYSNKYFLGEVFSSDLYVVLRPSKYYSPVIISTMELDSNGGEWTAETCKSPAVFDSSNKTCSMDIRYRSTYGELPIPNREGYEFVKWVYSDNEDKEIASNTLVEFSSDIQVQARWIKRENPEKPSPIEDDHITDVDAIKVENTLSTKSIIFTIVAIVLISTGTCIIVKNTFMV